MTCQDFPPAEVYGRDEASKTSVLERHRAGWQENQNYTSQYEADVIKLLTQIVDELQRIRISVEERERMQQEEDEDLLKRIEKTHRNPTFE
jgi:hypothetical protein